MAKYYTYFKSGVYVQSPFGTNDDFYKNICISKNINLRVRKSQILTISNNNYGLNASIYVFKTVKVKRDYHATFGKKHIENN